MLHADMQYGLERDSSKDITPVLKYQPFYKCSRKSSRFQHCMMKGITGT